MENETSEIDKLFQAQSKIVDLFKTIVEERNKYKHKLEKLEQEKGKLEAKVNCLELENKKLQKLCPVINETNTFSRQDLRHLHDSLETDKEKESVELENKKICSNEKGSGKDLSDSGLYGASSSQVSTLVKHLAGERSPVFKDVRTKKQDVAYIYESTNEKSWIKLVDEGIFQKCSKQSHSSFESFSHIKKSPKPKRAKTMTEFPQKVENKVLKKSNSREVNVSHSGVKKLTQTIVNKDFFSKNTKTLLRRPLLQKEENLSVKENKVDEQEDDEFIMESPRDPEQKKDKKYTNKVQLLTPPSSLALDPDETYVSLSVVRNCQKGGKEMAKNETPLKRPRRLRSPEYDFVPILFEEDQVRKKAERRKLPGHTCSECKNFYYKGLGNDINTQDLQKVLNKCSRHRYKDSLICEDTPPGYWKPYLTASCTVVSPGKNDTSLR